MILYQERRGYCLCSGKVCCITSHVLYCFSAFISQNIPLVQQHCVNDRVQADSYISLELFHNK